jgi:DNA (cytosine-5)-methyltransferase 1
MKILNLYAGIGGNRKNWDGDKHDITAVEINEEIAEIYQDNFPEDEVIVADAHEYLKENYEKFGFIWASPPCPTHSRMRRVGVEVHDFEEVYPDLTLFEEILFLKNFFDGDWVVENVIPYYKKQINWEKIMPYQKSGRHLFWSNLSIENKKYEGEQTIGGNYTLSELEDQRNMDLSKYDICRDKKINALKNMVDPKIGEAILKSRSSKQQKLPIE